MGGTREEIGELLQLYRALGCNRIVALRGDLPSGMARMGDLRYATDLVAFIREEHGDHFHIEVGCYPGNPSAGRRCTGRPAPLQGQGRCRRRIRAITQYFYNADAYFRFVDDARKLGIDVPIVPGIMPISNFTQLKRFSEACGAEIPRWIGKRMAALGDDADGIREFAADLVGACAAAPDRWRRARAAFLHAEPEQTHRSRDRACAERRGVHDAIGLR